MSGNIHTLKVRSRSVRLSHGDGATGREVVVRKCKSLPCVHIHVGDRGRNVREEAEGVLQRKPTKPKILRKTWDKVKGIIHPSSSGDGQSRKGGGSSCSTPLLEDCKFFEQEDDQRERIARNYALLQKRLSQEFRQSSLKGKGSFGGEFTDEFKRKLFEWESHPSRRKGKGVPKESASAPLVGGLSSRHLKELAWLDKQLEKIETEKARLEEELKKQVEREIRIQKMKEALSVSDRVYNIRTDNGVRFRVEPFTSEYAMKVYEWEEKRGIGVEMSALGYFDPKYRDIDHQDDHEEVQVRDEVGKVEISVEQVDHEKDDEVVVGPLDLINERLKNAGSDGLAERGEMLLQECIALGEAAGGRVDAGVSGVTDGRASQFSSTDCSVCSADESFATKNNSGASNTDSDLYDKRCTITRRRSSCCVSTPDRGSPDRLSLLTGSSEEEVNNKEEKKDSLVVPGPLCVKQIVVISGDEDQGAVGGFNNVFVPTKRTIFTPVSEDFDADGGELARSSGEAVVEVEAPCCGGPKIVGATLKSNVNYKPQPKTQLHRVFPGNSVYCSPMAARKAYREEGDDSGKFRRLPPRTNINVPRKYTIGGGYPPNFSRGCIIARSNSFQFRGLEGGEGRRDSECAGVEGLTPNSISKSKSTGSIKRSIASVKCFLGLGGSGGRDQREVASLEQQEGSVSGERRGSRGRWRFWGKGKEGE